MNSMSPVYLSRPTRPPAATASLAGIAIRYRCGESFLSGWSTSWSIEPAPDEQPADGYQPPALLVCDLICHHCGRQHIFTFQQ